MIGGKIMHFLRGVGLHVVGTSLYGSSNQYGSSTNPASVVLCMALALR
jgi:hypothetical protein